MLRRRAKPAADLHGLTDKAKEKRELWITRTARTVPQSKKSPQVFRNRFNLVRANLWRFAGTWPFQQEGKRHQARDNDGHHPERVYVGEQRGLLLDQSHHLVVRLLHGEYWTRARLRHFRRRAMQHFVELRIGCSRICDQGSLVNLALSREESGQHGNADAASQIADEVADAGDLVVLVGRNSYIAQDADGNKDERQPGHLVHTPQHDGTEINSQAEMRDVIERERGHAES